MGKSFYRGKKAAVSFGPKGEGVVQVFDTWTLVARADPIDCSDFDQPSRQYLHDLPSATLTMGGPYTDELLNIKPSNTGEVTLLLDEEQNVGFPLTILVTECNLRIDARGVARFELSAVVTGNITESVNGEFTEEVLF